MNLPDEMVIGLSGHAQAGKDTVGQYLVRYHGFTRLAFADLLKEVLYRVNPVVLIATSSCAFDEGVEDVVQRLGWEEAKKQIPEVRRLLQQLGVAMRFVEPDVWVHPVREAILASPGRYVITDVRFPNELKMIWAFGNYRCPAVNVLVERDVPEMFHISEHALEGFMFDEILHNDGPIYELYAQVERLVERLAGQVRTGP
jgi:hypothetical protein